MQQQKKSLLNCESPRKGERKAKIKNFLTLNRRTMDDFQRNQINQ